MKDDFMSLLKRKQVIGVIVAAVVLSVIFVPLQHANAASLDLNLSNSVNGLGIVSQDDPATGKFTLTLNLAPSELFHAGNMTVSIDNGTSNQVFAPNGQSIGGDNNLISNFTIRTNLTNPSGYGYGYGYGNNNGYGSGGYGYGGYGYGYSNPVSYSGPGTVTFTGL